MQNSTVYLLHICCLFAQAQQSPLPHRTTANECMVLRVVKCVRRRSVQQLRTSEVVSGTHHLSTITTVRARGGHCIGHTDAIHPHRAVVALVLSACMHAYELQYHCYHRCRKTAHQLRQNPISNNSHCSHEDVLLLYPGRQSFPGLGPWINI